VAIKRDCEPTIGKQRLSGLLVGSLSTPVHVVVALTDGVAELQVMFKVVTGTGAPSGPTTLTHFTVIVIASPMFLLNAAAAIAAVNGAGFPENTP